jgi:ATP-binding cassette subfamily B protein
MNADVDYLLKFLKKRYLLILIGLVFLVITDLMVVFYSRSIGYFIDFFNGDGLPQFVPELARENTFIYLVLLVLASRAILAVARFGWRYFLSRQSHYAAFQLKKEFWDRVRLLPWRALSRKYPKGILMNYLTSDVNMARMLFGFQILEFLDIFLIVTISLVSMFYINCYMTLGLTLIFLPMPLLANKLVRKEGVQYELSQRSLGKLNQLCSEIVDGINVVKLTSSYGYSIERLIARADNYRVKRFGTIMTSLKFYPLVTFFWTVFLIMLLAVSIHSVYQGIMTVGGLIAFMQLADGLFDPVLDAGIFVFEVKKSRVSLSRLIKLLNEERDFNYLGKETPSDFTSENILVAKNIGLSYENKTILHNLNLSLNQGDKLGIIGPTGSGKSMFIKILSGIIPPTQGDVFLWGRKYSSYGHDFIRSKVLIVPQKSFLFTSSIRENIALNRTMSDDEILKYIKMVDLDEDVLAFPQGIYTSLGEKGVNLSGGQRQRVALAMAISYCPKILFLDDCFSALDLATEENILSRMVDYLKDSTIVWVAHRMSTLRYCNKTLKL